MGPLLSWGYLTRSGRVHLGRAPLDERLIAWAMSSCAALLGCSSVVPVRPIDDEPGTLELPLATARDGVTYRLIATLRIVDEDGSLVETVEGTSDGPNSLSVTLSPGSYSVEVNEGYTCSVTPADESYIDCTYAGARPESFAVITDETTHVTLDVTFHFDTDVQVGFYTGEAELVFRPSIERVCGSGCIDSKLCVKFEDEAPQCANRCERDDGCGIGGQCFPRSDKGFGSRKRRLGP